MRISRRTTTPLTFCYSHKKASFQFNSESLFFCPSIIIIALILFLLSCTGTPKQKSVLISKKSLSSLITDKLDRFEASGDFAVSFSSERYRGEIVVTLNERYNFVCDLYSPFGQIIATFISDKDSAKINMGENEYRIGVYDNLSIIPFLTDYPFIFSDFVRIITGRVIKRDCFYPDADTVWQEGRRDVYEWISDSVNISAMVSSDGKRIKNVSCTALKGPFWKLEYSSFKNGISRKISFESGEKNYFSLVFDKMRL